MIKISMGLGLVVCSILFIISISLVVFVDGELSDNYFSTSELYQNYEIGNELEVSVDKFTYKQGEIINIIGQVYSSTKQTVYLEFYSASGEKVYWVQTSPGNTKNFHVMVEIPEDFPNGKYTINARFGGGGLPVSLDIVIDGNPDFIKMPLNSYVDGNMLSFEPTNFNVKVGDPIVFKNDDITVHRIIEGAPKFYQLQENDADVSLFDTGYIKPGQTFQIYLDEGEYQYFCTIHPWTVGYITVHSLNDNTENSVFSSQPFFMEENEDYMTIKTASESYSSVDSIELLGIVKKFEPESNLIIQVMDPNDDLVAVGQIIVIQDKSCCLESDDHKKVLANDSLSNWFAKWSKNRSVLLTTSDPQVDPYQGVNSLKAIIDTSKGQASIFHDYGTTTLQDWSEYDYLSFWYKGQGIAGVEVILRDESWGTGGAFKIIEDSNKWTQILVPLSDTYEDLNLSKVRTLEFNFPYEKITDGELSIDKIELLKSIPELGGSFAFTINDLNFIPDKNGLYKINALYGEKREAQTSFLMNVALLVEEGYEGFDIYKEGVKYYGIPTGQDFDSSRLRNIDYNKIFSSDSLESLKVLVKPFPVSDGILLKVWNARDDIKSDYPEVAIGDFSNLKEWAISTGWKEENLLYALAPDETQLTQASYIVLTNDKLSNWFTLWKKDQSVLLTISSPQGTPYGANGLEARIDTSNGPASFFHDYGTTTLQDWSEYDYLSFWYKGQGIAGVEVIVRDESWEAVNTFKIIEDANEWSQIIIPLSTYEKLNLSKVRTLEFNFPYEKITDGKLNIDKIELLKEINKNTVPIVNDQILLVIWEEETKLQSNFPEVGQGDLEKLKVWATNKDLKTMLSELHLQKEIPPEAQNTIQSESEKLMTPSVNSGMDADAIIPTLQAIVGVTVVVIGGLFGYKKYKDYKKDINTISPDQVYSF